MPKCFSIIKLSILKLVTSINFKISNGIKEYTNAFCTIKSKLLDD